MRPRIFLDSGAFGAWKRGVVLDVDRYIEFIQEHRNRISEYVCMDTIPASPDWATRTRVLLEAAAHQSYEALRRMRRMGLAPIPVYHQGERTFWLERMLADGESYIGLSFYRRSHRNEIRRWFDSCFDLISRERRAIRTHGFGLTAPPLVLDYPWTTVDSTTWAYNAGYAHVWVPPWRDGQFDYGGTNITFTVSGRPPRAGRCRPFEMQGLLVQETILRFFAEVGVSLVQVRHSAEVRRRLCVYYLLQLVRYKAARGQPCSVVFVSSLSHRDQLLSCGADHHLLTYFDLVNKPGLLREYVDGESRPSCGPRPEWSSETYRSWRMLGLYECATVADPNDDQ